MEANYHSLLRRFALLTAFAGLTTVMLVAQTTVTGVITDAENGEPLIGANIIIRGSSIGTITDIDGNYSILAAPEDVLIFSYTGYSSQEIPVGDQTQIDIQLSAGQLLEEIVVIGYGTAKRKDLTGSVALLNNEDFNQGVIVSADQLIQGRTAGVQVVNNSGQPGGATTVRIRGNTSIRLNSGPVYVLDGVPLSGTSGRPDLDIAGLGGSPSANPLNFLNPLDVESISVLKDASATGIYGSIGANGVIEITTKAGRNQKPTISFNSSLGVSSVLPRYEVLNASEYRQALSDYGISSGDYGDDVNAFDEVTRTALINNHAFSINGGSARGSYRFSAGYFKQDGVVRRSSLRRVNANFRAKYNFLPDDRISLDMWVVTAQTKEGVPPISTNSGFRGSLIGNALQWNPTHRLYEDDGSPVIIPEFGNFTNPVALLDAYDDEANTFDVIGSIKPTVKIIDNLSYSFLYSVNHSVGDRRASLPTWINIEDVEGRGAAYLFNRKVTTQVLNHTLNYNLDFGSNSSLGILAGYEYRYFSEKNQNMIAQDFPNTSQDYTNFIQNGSQSSRSIGSSAPPITELQSYLGRVNLNLADRFLLTATFRADGSSKFGANNRYGYFPALGAAWNIHNEGFAEGGLFDNLKLRAGWGITGNQAFPSGASLDRYALQDNGAAQQTNVGNPDLRWETTTTWNAALDFAMFNYRLTGTVEYFSRTTTDILFQIAPSQPAPATLYWVNLDGEVANRGVEIMANYYVFDRPTFKWDLGVNVTFLTNELTNYEGPNFLYGQIFGQGVSNATIHRLAPDQPLNAFYVRDWQGLNAEGFDTFIDADGNLVENTTDAFYLGDPNPSTLLGIQSMMEFGQKFSLQLNFNGSFGNDIYNNTKNTVTPIGNLAGGRNIDGTLVGNDVQESTANSVKTSSRYLESGNYVKLANATFTWNIGRVGSQLEGVKLFLSGQNLLLFTPYDGFDPEVNTINDANGLPSAGIDYIPFPTARTFILGVNFTL